MLDNQQKCKNLAESLNKALPSSVIAQLEDDLVIIQSKLNGKKVWLNGDFRIVGEAG